MSKPLMSILATACVLALPAVAHSRPVTLTAQLKNYGGDGAYLAAYLTDAKGAYVRTLWVAGGKAKYYKHLSDWSRLSGGRHPTPEWCHRRQRGRRAHAQGHGRSGGCTGGCGL